MINNNTINIINNTNNNINNIDNIINNTMNNIDNTNNTIDNIINTEYYFLYKKIIYDNKIIKNYYFSKYLIIYKYFDNNYNILREKIKIYKNNNKIHSKVEYYIDGEIKIKIEN